MKLFPRLVFCCSIVWLVSCSTQPDYAPNVLVVEAGTEAEPPEESQAADASRDNLQYEQEKQIAAAEAITYSTDGAVQSLIEQAELKYRRGEIARAIALAERALRINRRSPEAYLILAQCYWQQILPEQARQFAQKGLGYSDAGSQVYLRLTDLLERM